MALVSNVTPLVIELLSGINGSNGGYRHALLKALCRVLAAAGKSTPPLTSKALEGVDGVILGLFCSEEGIVFVFVID